MMRPPKSVRDRLKAIGEWSREETPPPDYPIEEASPDSPVLPVPGSYSPVFNAFQALQEEESVDFSVEEQFIEIYRIFKVLVWSSSAVAERISSVGMTKHSFLSRLMAVGSVAVAMQLTETRNTLLNKSSIRDEKIFPNPCLPMSMVEYVQNVGEFVGPDGRKWMMYNLESSVKALNRTAYSLYRGRDFQRVVSRQWLPCWPDDMRTNHIVACHLQDWFKLKKIHVPFKTLQYSLFSGTIPPEVLAALHCLDGVDPQMVRRLFQVYSTEEQFLDMFSDALGIYALDCLSLEWEDPKVEHLMFDFDQRKEVARVLQHWRDTYKSYQSVFGTGFVPVLQPRPTGSKIQTVRACGSEGEWTLQSFYPLSDVEKTTAVCLGNPVIRGSLPDRYLVTGSVPADLTLYAILQDEMSITIA